MTTRPMVKMERLTTGDAAFDRILDGGFPSRSINVVMGAPGAGKTLFALQMLFHLARRGKKALYFTTLSEPAVKLLGYMQQVAFFDAALVDELITFVDIGSELKERGSEAALATIVQRVEDDEPAVVVIDSFKALSEFVPDARLVRSLVYDLAVHMASWGATTFLLGEYVDEDITSRSEFAVADGIVRFGSSDRDHTTVRDVAVLKLRGSSYVSGQHFFDIGPNGVSFYPRVHMPSAESTAIISPSERVSTGVAGLNQLLGGGLPRASSTVVQGGTGTGKTLLGLHFLLDGMQRGEPGVLFTLEENVEQLTSIARNFGWELAELEKKGLIVEYTSPVEISTDRFLHRARRRIDEHGAKRAVIDSLSSLALGAPSPRRFKEVVYAISKHFRAAEVSLFMTMEIDGLLGSTQLSGHGISFAADNLLQLRYVEIDGRLERGISVLKARGIRHGTEVRRVTIGDRGMVVGEVFEGARGVLSGLVSPAGVRT